MELHRFFYAVQIQHTSPDVVEEGVNNVVMTNKTYSVVSSGQMRTGVVTKSESACEREIDDCSEWSVEPAASLMFGGFLSRMGDFLLWESSRFTEKN